MFKILFFSFLFFINCELFASEISVFGDSVSSEVGKEFVLDLKSKNFLNVAGLQLFLNFNKDFVQFKGINKSDFDFLFHQKDGFISFVWDDFQNLKNIDNNDVFLSLTFEILKSGYSNVYFSDNSAFFDQFGNKINSSFSIINIEGKNAVDFYSKSSGGSSGYRKNILKPDVLLLDEKKLEKCVFSDSCNHWANNYIENLYYKGVFDKNKNFNPDNFLKRIDLLKIVILLFDSGFSYGDYLNSSNHDYLKFTDVKKNDRYGPYFLRSLEKGIVDSSNTSNKFRPSDFVNRAEALKIIFKLIGTTTCLEERSYFSDVVPGSWYEKYVNCSFENGVISGYGDGKFGPGDFITRGEISKIISNVLQKYYY